MTHAGLVEGTHTRQLDLPRGLEHTEKLGIRVNNANDRHHLWNNNGTWFVHYTVYPDSLTARRIRRSLKTKSLSQAIERRDAILLGGDGI